MKKSRLPFSRAFEKRHAVSQLTHSLLTITNENKNPALVSMARKIIRAQLLPAFSEAEYGMICNPVWSLSAVEKYSNNTKGREKITSQSIEGLVLEHLIPRKEIVEFIFCMKSPTVDSIHKFLSKANLAAVITKIENKRLDTFGFKSKMPGQKPWWEEHDLNIFARYRNVQEPITLWSVDWSGHPIITPTKTQQINNIEDLDRAIEAQRQM